jgi:hypothetical protein
MPKKKKSNLLKWLLILTLILVIIFSFANSCQTTTVGYNNLGQVVKYNYSHYSNPEIKIAVVSGMHSRESLHQLVLPEVCKVLALFNNVEVVNYKVQVTSNPEDFDIGRSNGESLVHDYVVSDVAKSNYDLVIIGHDHESDYGEGYYIATPSMDDSSVSLANKVTNSLSNFNYYKRDTSVSAKSTSINSVDNPIVSTGTKLFVYEIPEDDFAPFAFINSYRLIYDSYKILSS